VTPQRIYDAQDIAPFAGSMATFAVIGRPRACLPRRSPQERYRPHDAQAMIGGEGWSKPWLAAPKGAPV
jgi:hypothetical protein